MNSLRSAQHAAQEQPDGEANARLELCIVEHVAGHDQARRSADDQTQECGGGPHRLIDRDLAATAFLSLVVGGQIGSTPVCTPVTNAHLVCRLILEKKNIYRIVSLML